MYFLELILKPEFCKKLLDVRYVRLIHDNQYYHWHSYRYLRAKEKEDNERLRIENAALLYQSQSVEAAQGEVPVSTSSAKSSIDHVAGHKRKER